MTSSFSRYIPVVDFRRQSMILQWHIFEGSWSGCDVPPPLVHGVALIRAAKPNICLYARDDKLHLQVGADQYAFSDTSPHIKSRRGWASFGLRSRFTVESSSGDVLFAQAYWHGQGEDFFTWLTVRAADPEWRKTHSRRWSRGVTPADLRAS